MIRFDRILAACGIARRQLILSTCMMALLAGCGSSGSGEDSSSQTEAPPVATAPTPAVPATPSAPAVSTPVAAATVPPVSAKWTAPALNSNVSGAVKFSLTGASLKKVEIYLGSTLAANAAVTADGKSATATIDTKALSNGWATFTARAYDAKSKAVDVGSLKVTINNVSVAANPCNGITCSGHGSCSATGGKAACSCATGFHPSGLACIQDPPKLGALLGVYVGNNPADVSQFETWLGHKVDGVLGYTGNNGWADYDGSVGWAAGVWSKLDRRVLWSIPLIPNNGTLAAAARGDYNDHYLAAARTLAKFRPQDREIYIRTAWEMNGNWFNWNAIGKQQDFILAFRQFVSAYRSVSDRFVFEWNVNVMDGGIDPATAYPGDDYVDIIGMDFYWNTKWDTEDAATAWKMKLNSKYGLKWHQAFAAAHNKRTAYSEWGVNSNNAQLFIANARAWFESHDVVYQTYWNSNSAFSGKLSDGQYPQSAAAYREQFKE